MLRVASCASVCPRVWACVGARSLLEEHASVGVGVAVVGGDAVKGVVVAVDGVRCCSDCVRCCSDGVRCCSSAASEV